MSERGCAQDENGNLLSPSKIKWYNDVDDELPISDGNAALPSSSSTLSCSKPTVLTRFFAPVDTGARRSTRTTRPSTKVTDPDNAESHALYVPSGGKRKASTQAAGGTQQPRRIRKVIEDSDNDISDGVSLDTGDANNDYVELTEKESDDEEDIEANYASTKALGDADRKVCVLYRRSYRKVNKQFEQLDRRPKSEKTADISTIFVADSHTNPDTGVIEKRHICTLCKYDINFLSLYFRLADHSSGRRG